MQTITNLWSSIGKRDVSMQIIDSLSGLAFCLRTVSCNWGNIRLAVKQQLNVVILRELLGFSRRGTFLSTVKIIGSTSLKRWVISDLHCIHKLKQLKSFSKILYSLLSAIVSQATEKALKMSACKIKERFRRVVIFIYKAEMVWYFFEGDAHVKSHTLSKRG